MYNKCTRKQKKKIRLELKTGRKSCCGRCGSCGTYTRCTHYCYVCEPFNLPLLKINSLEKHRLINIDERRQNVKLTSLFKPIESDTEYYDALEIISTIMHTRMLTPDEHQYLEVMPALVEAWEIKQGYTL